MVVTDNQMMATTSAQHSPEKERRESMPDTSANFSPHDAAWPGYSFSLEHSASDGTDPNMHTFFAASSGAVMPHSSAAQSASFSPQSGWHMTDGSGSCTPTPTYDQLVFPQSQQQQQSNEPQSQAFNPVRLQHPQQIASGAAFPATSPDTGKESWFGTPADGMDFRPLPAEKPHSPAFAHSTHILRRDGIRKKNARFEIPAERNLRTIDQLINQTSDEKEIKELKQQKRLLRNRQAALDSRQRKKQHTERLEEEKKHYTTVISDLEEEMAEYKAQAGEYVRAKESWGYAQQQWHEHIELLRIQKDDDLRQHTLETGELRKKNAILCEQLQRIESTAMSTAPSSAGFSADFSEFDGLTMNSWDDFSISNDFSLEHDTQTDVAMVSAKKDQQSKAGGEDKAVTSSLLLMLLLCGAWVVSRGPKSSTEILPAASEEMKSASAAVLDNLYRDSGIHLGNGHAAQRPLSDHPMGALSRSSLDNLHHRLTQPTNQQLHDQAFSLTPTQYNDMHTGIASYAPATSAYEAGIAAPTVAQILSADPSAVDGGGGNSRHGGAAETYTRSVLKGRVSADVLKEFARMVAVTKQGSLTQGQVKGEHLE